MFYNLKKKVIISGICLTGVTGSVHAFTQYPPEGGRWDYGYTIYGAYSNYYNAQQSHGSTVSGTDSRGTFRKNQAEADKGDTSYAFIQDVHSGASFYYNIFN